MARRSSFGTRASTSGRSSTRRSRAGEGRSSSKPREAPRSANLSPLLGVAPHRVRYVVDQSRRFSAARLRRALEDLADLDVASKTGRGDAVAALEEWLIALCAPERKRTDIHVGRR